MDHWHFDCGSACLVDLPQNKEENAAAGEYAGGTGASVCGKAFIGSDLTQPDASKPRSLAGMDRLCLPQIAKDFPEFNWSEWKAQIETELRKKLEKEYQKVHIHRTVISRYQKEKGLCRILCESAVEYEKMTEYEKTPEMQSELHSNLIQTVYETELVYVYEDTKTAGAAVSLICPNCGAPIQKLGLKKCEYCGSVLEVQNKKAWRLLEMREK